MLAHRLQSPKAKAGVCADSDTLQSEIEHKVLLVKLKGFYLPLRRELVRSAVCLKT